MLLHIAPSRLLPSYKDVLRQAGLNGGPNMPWQVVRRDEKHLRQQRLYGGVVAYYRHMRKEAPYGSAARLLLREVLDLAAKNGVDNTAATMCELEGNRRLVEIHEQRYLATGFGLVEEPLRPAPHSICLQLSCWGVPRQDNITPRPLAKGVWWRMLPRPFIEEEWTKGRRRTHPGT